MKLNILSAFHYLIFFGLMLLLAPLKMMHSFEKSSNCDKTVLITETNKQVSLANENTEELLHGEILFRY